MDDFSDEQTRFNAPVEIEVWRVCLEQTLSRMRDYRARSQLSRRRQDHLDYLIYKVNSLINHLDQLERAG